jgi:hypothetical protein
MITYRKLHKMNQTIIYDYIMIRTILKIRKDDLIFKNNCRFLLNHCIRFFSFISIRFHDIEASFKKDNSSKN